MPQPLLDFYHSILDKNWFATAALAIMIGTQLLKTLPVVRAKVWAKIPLGYRWSVPVVAAALTAFVHGFQVHETLGASIWDAVKIALSAMGAAAALKESPLPWSGGAGGTPAPLTAGSDKVGSLWVTNEARPLSVIPPLRDALTDDDATPVDHPPPPPDAA